MASNLRMELREKAWHEYLKVEVVFNASLMKDLHTILKTPKQILELLVGDDILSMEKTLTR